MKKLAAILLALLFCSPAWAASHYFRADCANNGDGTTLGCAAGTGAAGAYNAPLASETYAYGDTYYIAGSATTYAGFNINGSTGTGSTSNRITFKKVNASDNSGVSGYSAGMVSTQAVVTFFHADSVSYITIDGVTGSGNSGHGIKVAATGATWALVQLNFNTSITDVIFRHLEVTDSGWTDEDEPESCDELHDGISTYNNSTITLEYVYIHHIGAGSFTSGSGSGIIIRDSFFGFQCGNPAWHSGTITVAGVNGANIYRNIFEDCASTGYTGAIGTATGSSGLTTQNINVYNNIFRKGASSRPMGGSGIGLIACWSMAECKNWMVYGNTFYNMGSTAGVYFHLNDANTTNSVSNNLWYCDVETCGSAETENATTKTNNWYSDKVTHSTDSGTHYGAACDPFTNSASLDFTLKSSDSCGDQSPKDHGATLGSPYNVDYLGTVRPQGAAYDIGAYEYYETGSIRGITASGITIR